MNILFPPDFEHELTIHRLFWVPPSVALRHSLLEWYLLQCVFFWAWIMQFVCLGIIATCLMFFLAAMIRELIFWVCVFCSSQRFQKLDSGAKKRKSRGNA